MSEADIDLIKAAFAAFNDAGCDRMLDLSDDGAEIQRIGDLGTPRGKRRSRIALPPTQSNLSAPSPRRFVILANGSSVESRRPRSRWAAEVGAGGSRIGSR